MSYHIEMCPGDSIVLTDAFSTPVIIKHNHKVGARAKLEITAEKAINIKPVKGRKDN